MKHQNHTHSSHLYAWFPIQLEMFTGNKAARHVDPNRMFLSIFICFTVSFKWQGLSTQPENCKVDSLSCVHAHNFWVSKKNNFYLLRVEGVGMKECYFCCILLLYFFFILLLFQFCRVYLLYAFLKLVLLFNIAFISFINCSEFKGGGLWISKM